MTPSWHFGPPRIPVRAFVISGLALAVPVVAAVTAPEIPIRLEPLLWLTALIPGFLLAYYRGWRGVATGLAFSMAVFGLVEIYLVLTDRRLPDWPFMLSMTAAMVVLSLLAGEVSERLHSDRERAERLALIDPLTRLPNRRYFELVLEREFAAARRGRELVLAAFDLDGLKRINDEYGHSAGDDAIRSFAEVLEANTRAMNVSARLGGDEFACILSSSTMDGATVFAERVQAAADGIDGLPFQVSVSVGLASYTGDMVSPEALVHAADRALYQVKQDPAVPARG